MSKSKKQKVEVLAYKGVDYHTRKLEVMGDYLTIGTYNLSHTLDEDYEEGEDSEEFQTLYSEVTLYVPEELIEATDREILEFLVKSFSENI